MKCTFLFFNCDIKVSKCDNFVIVFLLSQKVSQFFVNFLLHAILTPSVMQGSQTKNNTKWLYFKEKGQSTKKIINFINNFDKTFPVRVLKTPDLMEQKKVWFFCGVAWTKLNWDWRGKKGRVEKAMPIILILYLPTENC